MTQARVFTDAELKEMGTLTLDAIAQALDAGDSEKARKLSRRMYREFQAMHDLYRDWVTALLDFVAKRYGEPALDEALHESCAAWMKPLAQAYAGKDFRRTVEMLATGYRGHLQPMVLEEDDEKVVMNMPLCGSGARLVREGKYGPGGFGRVDTPQRMTFGKTDFPIYCCHCPFQEILPIEWSGAPIFITVPAEKVGEGTCQVVIYKDPKYIPAEMYERLGKKKAGAR